MRTKEGNVVYTVGVAANSDTPRPETLRRYIRQGLLGPVLRIADSNRTPLLTTTDQVDRARRIYAHNIRRVGYAREIVPKKAPRTQLDNQRYIGQMRKTFGDWPSEEVTKAAGRDFRDKLGENSGAVQANRHLEVLKNPFRIALAEWDARLDRDVLNVKKLEMEKRDRYVSTEEFAAVYAKAPASVRVAMDLALLIGLRRSDLLRLTRADCKDDGIHCRTSKTGVPLFEWHRN